MGVFLSNLCVVGAIIAVTANVRVEIRLALAALFALAGTSSFGQGVVIWPVVALLRGTFSVERLPPGTTEISAWTVDADKGKTFRLPGSFVVEK